MLGGAGPAWDDVAVGGRRPCVYERWGVLLYTETKRQASGHSSVGVSVLYTQGGRYVLNAPRVWAGDL